MVQLVRHPQTKERDTDRLHLNQYAVKVGDLQWVRIPSGQSVARPEAIRAAQGGNDMR
jgi:hypothetical protein